MDGQLLDSCVWWANYPVLWIKYSIMIILCLQYYFTCDIKDGPPKILVAYYVYKLSQKIYFIHFINIQKEIIFMGVIPYPGNDSNNINFSPGEPDLLKTLKFLKIA